MTDSPGEAVKRLRIDAFTVSVILLLLVLLPIIPHVSADDINQGHSFTIPVTCFNSASSTIRNVVARTADPWVTEKQQVIGDLAPGARKTVVFNGYVPDAAPLGPHTVTFECVGTAASGATTLLARGSTQFSVIEAVLPPQPQTQTQHVQAQTTAQPPPEQQAQQAQTVTAPSSQTKVEPMPWGGSPNQMVNVLNFSAFLLVVAVCCYAILTRRFPGSSHW